MRVFFTSFLWDIVLPPCISRIMHDRTDFIWPHHIGLANVNFPEIMFLAISYVVPDDGDVVISVRATLFMPEPNCMHQLVHNPARKPYQTCYI